MDKRRTIPVVWGVFRPWLMLPIEARDWSGEQLRLVLLHELAHIKRRDTLVQWLTQIACALHWWNPLVWLAAWRLHAERERACDDLVLASGVRPSAYAEHLLHVATKLSPARWTAACGLAMAKKSRLEGRLLAVLSEKLNRRGVTSALAAIALILGAGIAVPVAMLRAADEKKPDEKVTGITGKLAPETVAKLKWGEPVNGLRMALAWPPALGDALLGETDYFQLVVQNVSEKDVRFISGDDAPNPRKMHWRDGERVVQSLGDDTAQKVDWKLKPGECGVLRLFTKEERGKDGKTISALLEADLHPQTRYHAIGIMEVAKAPAGAWTGKLMTGPTRGSADKADAPAPKHKDARALYEIWQRHARANGDIPGALIGELAKAVKAFIGYNPTWETVPKLNTILPRLDAALRPRLDASRDWTQAEVVAVLDEITAISTAPVSWADIPMEFSSMRSVKGVQPLPVELQSAAWGAPVENGLRAAWLLEPRAEQYALGSVLKARVLFHNAGKCRGKASCRRARRNSASSPPTRTPRKHRAARAGRAATCSETKCICS